VVDELSGDASELFAQAEAVYEEYARRGAELQARGDAYNARISDYDALRRRHKRGAATRDEVDALFAELGSEAEALAGLQAEFEVTEARYLELRPQLERMRGEARKRGGDAARERRRGALLEAFAALDGAGVGPTPYGASNMHESFADAFALYKLDPAALERFSPEMHAWFAAGGHLAHLEVSKDLADVP
jgi:hypothetical protein